MTVPALDFVLPAHLEKGEPPGHRDEVRLMVGSRSDQQIIDTTFPHLPDFLRSGDVLVINTSATLPAALDATIERGEQVVVHFSSRLPDGNWTVEVRRPQ
ncbi:MAG: S-adenosylmethionine:tRNA ribosyltransferase-isomerase, partial [Actinobacteria bacterium]|nr:S-adenosylmethionine:tRNA ribosyltransferase-isomerase [Actinomycetota bacterium]